MTGSTRNLRGNSIFSFPERKNLSLKVIFGSEIEWGHKNVSSECEESV